LHDKKKEKRKEHGINEVLAEGASVFLQISQELIGELEWNIHLLHLLKCIHQRSK
jgi:hypothetical protein